jgi:hypothetical protein
MRARYVPRDLYTECFQRAFSCQSRAHKWETRVQLYRSLELIWRCVRSAEHQNCTAFEERAAN